MARHVDTTYRLRHEIDSGQSGDKIGFPDPTSAPLGTDDEAAGTPAPPDAVRETAAYETSRGPQRTLSPKAPRDMAGNASGLASARSGPRSSLRQRSSSPVSASSLGWRVNPAPRFYLACPATALGVSPAWERPGAVCIEAGRRTEPLSAGGVAPSEGGDRKSVTLIQITANSPSAKARSASPSNAARTVGSSASQAARSLKGPMSDTIEISGPIKS
jgi:hypothetical protein